MLVKGPWLETDACFESADQGDLWLCGQILVRESRNSFLLYASGRRFCQSLKAKVELQRRQDLLSLVYYRFEPRDDYVDLEVHMNDASMPPLVRPSSRQGIGKFRKVGQIASASTAGRALDRHSTNGDNVAAACKPVQFCERQEPGSNYARDSQLSQFTMSHLMG